MMIIKKKSTKIKLNLIALALFFIIIVFGFDKRVRPMIETYASNQASKRVTQIVSQSVYEELSENSMNYGDFVKLTYGENGIVTSLQTDIVEINQLQSSLTRRIIAHVMEFNNQTIYISFGAIVGGPLFSGRGPNIEIKLIPSNFIETRIKNEFSSAGINQTRHRILLGINLTVTTVMPGYRSTANINTNMVLAETVIVGAVPEAFTYVSDGTDPLVGMLQDYGATVTTK